MAVELKKPSTFQQYKTLLRKGLEQEFRTKEMLTSMGIYALLVIIDVYKRQSHNWVSPLENKQLIENDCSKCHDDLEKKVKDIQASEEAVSYTHLAMGGSWVLIFSSLPPNLDREG